jgi:phasin family protein
MIKTPAQFAAAGNAVLDVCTKSVTTAVESVERLTALNLNTARSALEDGTAAIRALLAVKSPNELVELQTSLAQPTAQKALAYYRHGFEILAQSLEELVKPYEVQFAEANKVVAAALEKAAASAPAGADLAVAAVRSLVATANSTYDSVNKAARQAVEIAEANVAAGTDAAIKAVEANTAIARKSA